jgi:CubicO group peptidase (beta-lactamase class C family)
MLPHRVLPCLICSALLATTLPARAADDPFAPIAPAMQKFVDAGEVSGIVTLVAAKDKILHQAAVGTSDRTRKMQTDDLFWIASMSKPMTAVAAAMLVDDGKLRFDDPVEKYIPEFKTLKVGGGGDEPIARPILLRDLLTHTSGLPYNYAVTQPHWTLQQFVHQIASQGLEFQPGAKWYYSNAGIDVVGYIVQVAAGMPLDQFMQKRLFDPLGMKDTTFWIAPENVQRYAHCYEQVLQAHTLKEVPFWGSYDTDITDRQRPPLGAAGIFSTAQDLTLFYQMMLHNGKVGDKVLLKPQTATQMFSNQIGALSAGGGLAWGYGFGIVADPSALESDKMLAPGSFGHVGIFGTNSWADPKRGVIYILLLERANTDDYLNSPMRIQFQNLAAKALDTPPQ